MHLQLGRLSYIRGIFFLFVIQSHLHLIELILSTATHSHPNTQHTHTDTYTRVFSLIFSREQNISFRLVYASHYRSRRVKQNCVRAHFFYRKKLARIRAYIECGAHVGLYCCDLHFASLPASHPAGLFVPSLSVNRR